MAEDSRSEQDDAENGEQQAEDTNGEGRAVLSRVLNKDVLIPAAATALAAAAAGLAAKKGPDLKDKIMGEAKEEAQDLGREGAAGAKEEVMGGGLGSLASGASKLMPGKGGGSKGSKKTRRLPIQRWTDVAVPVEVAFEKWTNFEEFPKFMHRVLKVEQKDDKTLDWEEKIWFSKRQWQGEITDQRKNDRIAWKTVSGTTHSGVVSFHKLEKNLTRVLVTVDFEPEGIIEKMGSGLRFAKRAVQADLARFKAYAELGDAEGLDYAAAPAEKEQRPGDQDDAQDGKDEKDEKDNEGRSETSSANGSDSDDRDSGRREREARREERRETVSAG